MGPMRFALLLLVACQPEAFGPTKSTSTTPTIPVTNTTPPTTVPTTTPGTVNGQRIILTTGAVVEGERIGEYDMSIWWNDAEDDSTIAVFDPAAWADYPDDDSVRFIRESDVHTVEAISLNGASYMDFLNERDIAINGSPLAGVSWVIMGNDGYHREEDGYGNYAWDLVKTDQLGARYTGYGIANTDFLVWDEAVTLPVAGEVVEVVRDAPDNTPGSYAPDAVNNLVGVWLGGHHYLYFLHFRQDTIPAEVQVGAVLDAGAYLGDVGNSGVTLEPHLHIAALYWDDSRPGEERMWSVPIQWKDVWTAGQTTGATQSDFATPQSFDWLSGTAF